jgi:hypothetical protein
MLKTRLENFFVNMKSTFQKRQVNPNLLLFQRQILNNLVITNKNLGPAVIKRDVYIKRVFNNHLLKTDTYQRIEPDEAAQILTTLKMKVGQFIQSFSHVLQINEKEYLLRSIKQHRNISSFYLTMKIHKTPMATWPIVAIRGSITAGLGTWLDQQLQPICKKLPTYLKSYFKLTDLLTDLLDLPGGARLFTADAVSMYTNINTNHALSVIQQYLPPTPHNKAIMTALDIIMKHNFFQFGDTSWLQLTGTAMGTPPAPIYATLYFGIHEQETILRKYGRFFLFYKRYIKNVLGIWHCANENFDRRMGESFQEDLDKFGQLRWEVSQRSDTVIFLDLQLTIKNGRLTYSLYEKPLNLHMYLPPHSAHPPGILRGLGFGMIYRLHRLNSETDTIDEQISTSSTAS